MSVAECRLYHLRLYHAAVVLAPFFVHLELLFKFFGYNPSLQKSVHQGITEEIARIKAAEGKKAH